MTGSAPKRSIIPYYFVAFFLVVLIANLIMIYIAMDSWTGLETKNHYVKGLQYNEALEGAARQEALHWSSDVAVELTQGLSGTITVTLQDRNGNALAGAKAAIKIIRPTHHGYDQHLNLTETAPGRYRTDATFPLEGNWDIKQIVSRDNDHFQAVKRVFIDGEGPR